MVNTIILITYKMLAANSVCICSYCTLRYTHGKHTWLVAKQHNLLSYNCDLPIHMYTRARLYNSSFETQEDKDITLNCFDNRTNYILNVYPANIDQLSTAVYCIKRA